MTKIGRVRRGEVVNPGDADLTDLYKRQWEGSRLPSWLTAQHLFVLELVGKGFKSKQIAEELELPASVVDKRVRELLRESGVRQRPAAAPPDSVADRSMGAAETMPCMPGASPSSGRRGAVRWSR